MELEKYLKKGNKKFLDYFCVESLEAKNTITFTQNGAGTLYYSTDQLNWYKLVGSVTFD
jgi:hypothetical protein